MKGPRLPCQFGVGLTDLKELSVYSKYCAFLYFVFIMVLLLFMGMSFIIGMPPIFPMAALIVVLSKLL